MIVWVRTSRDGPQFTEVYESRTAVLQAHEDYLAGTPEIRPHFERALDLAEQSQDSSNPFVDVGDGDAIAILGVHLEGERS